MIAISSRAKTASRRCDEILSLDYFELMEARQDVENDVENVLKMECKTEPCASSKLQCQFPNHETLLNELRTCAKIVTGKNKYRIISHHITKHITSHHTRSHSKHVTSHPSTTDITLQHITTHKVASRHIH